MKRINSLAAIVLLMASAGVSAAPVTYTFDSVSRFDSGRPTVALSISYGLLSITGILQNATTPTTISFQHSAADYATLGSRCVPIILTMMEKPGRYLLNVTMDAADTTSQVVSCGLEIKS